MLPFLQPKKISGMIMAKVKPEGDMQSEGMEGDHDPALMSAAEDLISAIHAKDAMRVASAIKAAFEISDSDPHMEGPMESDK